MITRPDIVLYNVVGAAWQIISQNTSTLADIFVGAPASELTDIQTFFAQNPPVVKLGFIRAATDAGTGAIYITVETEKEVIPYQFIGSNVPLESPSDASFVEQNLGSYFETNTKLTCISTNANKTAYLAEICKYILLFNRANLEVNYNFQEQAMSMGSLAPEKTLEPDIFTFRRDVMLTSKQLDTAEVLIQSGLLKHIIITPNGTNPMSFEFP